MVGGHFSCMKKRQNTLFSKENSELIIVQVILCFSFQPDSVMLGLLSQLNHWLNTGLSTLSV